MITKSMFNKRIDAGNERRGVAPIIATLLMVAIAVVGGILIFVFAQGFFNQTDIAPPAAEALTIFGYDARDIDFIDSHTGFTLNTLNSADSGDLTIGDAIALYVRNVGSSTITISRITILGSDYVLDAGGTTIAAALPDNGKFVLSTGTSCCTATGQAVVNAGQEMTIVAAYSGATGDVNLGKAFKVSITTGSGQVFSTQVVSGVRSGA